MIDHNLSKGTHTHLGQIDHKVIKCHQHSRWSTVLFNVRLPKVTQLNLSFFKYAVLSIHTAL